MKYAVVRQFPVKCFAHTQKSLWDLVITVHSISFLLAAVPIHIAVYVCVDRRVYICATTKYAMNSIKPGPIYAYRLDGLWFELSQCHHKMIEKKVLIKNYYYSDQKQSADEYARELSYLNLRLVYLKNAFHKVQHIATN